MSGLIFVEVSEKLFEFVELWKSLGDAFEKVNIKHKTILHEFPIIRFYSNEPIPTLHSIVHERIDSLKINSIIIDVTPSTSHVDQRLESIRSSYPDALIVFLSLSNRYYCPDTIAQYILTEKVEFLTVKSINETCYQVVTFYKKLASPLKKSLSILYGSLGGEKMKINKGKKEGLTDFGLMIASTARLSARHAKALCSVYETVSKLMHAIDTEGAQQVTSTIALLLIGDNRRFGVVAAQRVVDMFS